MGEVGDEASPEEFRSITLIRSRTLCLDPTCCSGLAIAAVGGREMARAFIAAIACAKTPLSSHAGPRPLGRAHRLSWPTGCSASAARRGKVVNKVETD